MLSPIRERSDSNLGATGQLRESSEADFSTTSEGSSDESSESGLSLWWRTVSNSDEYRETGMYYLMLSCFALGWAGVVVSIVYWDSGLYLIIPIGLAVLFFVIGAIIFLREGYVGVLLRGMMGRGFGS